MTLTNDIVHLLVTAGGHDRLSKHKMGVQPAGTSTKYGRKQDLHNYITVCVWLLCYSQSHNPVNH